MFVMQTSAMKTCFQIAECSFSYAKLSNISVTSKYLNEINIIIGKRQGSICHDERWAYRETTDNTLLPRIMVHS